MSNKIYSRAYLQNVPAEWKQGHFDNFINQFQDDLVNVASTGKTSYNVDMTVLDRPPISFTENELIDAIQKRFPDCKVTWEKEWFARNGGGWVRIIVIDWS